jgi:hypothetical protein
MVLFILNIQILRISLVYIFPMTKKTLENKKCLLLIINIPNLTKLFQRILFDMEFFRGVVFIGHILILMIFMQTFYYYKKMTKVLHI